MFSTTYGTGPPENVVMHVMRVSQERKRITVENN